ncbi:outer membrane scaffolding protein for murein synthesis (MipA/OmpV family) [Alteromonadaceae bacterium 2753L.S.0a.02]|nr:outer membrane scaffolding protein for murein synthesis (MipA/OmpV family) [Alteromonadaceae bacterium 2753L.S.0a.02]
MKLRFSVLGFLLALSLTPAVNAADIAGDVQSAGVNLNEDGGYLELGAGIGYVHNSYNTRQSQETRDAFADIDGSFVYRKKGFFIEIVQGTQDGLNLGYNVWQNPRWSVDLLGASMNQFYDPDLDTDIKPGDDEATRNEKLYNRHSFYLGTGVRVSHYIDNYVIQYRLVTDTLGGNGVVSTLRAGRGWQLRNWNFHGIVSASYVSAETNNYWFGVKDWQATEKYPAYSSDATLSFSLQFGLAKPITEKWVVKAFAGWIQTPQEARDSPFVDDSDASYITLSVLRVFSTGR